MPGAPDIDAAVAAARAYDAREGPYLRIDWQSDYARGLIEAAVRAFVSAHAPEQ